MSNKIRSKPAELERCTHSLRDVVSDPTQGSWAFDRPCILIAHTSEDDKGRPIHQDERGRTWS